MKKITLIIFTLFLALTIASCAKSSNKGEENNMKKSNSTVAVPIPLWEKKEDKPVANAWVTRVENILQENDINKVEFTTLQMGDLQKYSSEDKSLIERWKVLLPKFRCNIIPFEVYFGSPVVTLTFYKSDNSLPLLTGYPMPNIFCIEEGENSVMLRIENYDEVKEEFSAILKDMGIQIYEVVE